MGLLTHCKHDHLLLMMAANQFKYSDGYIEGLGFDESARGNDRCELADISALLRIYDQSRGGMTACLEPVYPLVNRVCLESKQSA